jgi:ketosteroid isomerase-like protein
VQTEASVANLTLVRSAIDAFNRRDVPALCELMTEDVELHPPVAALTGRAYVGHAGIDEWLRDVEESFASSWIEPIELRDLGTQVLVLNEFRIEGHGSRVPLVSELGLLCEIEDGRIAKWLGFYSHADVLAAVGG